LEKLLSESATQRRKRAKKRDRFVAFEQVVPHLATRRRPIEQMAQGDECLTSFKLGFESSFAKSSDGFRGDSG
jgi:hypothetical protein